MVDEVFEEKQDICSRKSTRQKVAAAAAVAVKGDVSASPWSSQG